MRKVLRSLIMPALRFPIGRSGQDLVLPEKILADFERFRQDTSAKSEAGGQLFGSLSSSEIVIEKITGPRPADNRGRFHFEPDRRAEQREIKEMHKRDLHYVGDWHTHPELVPSPSGRDLRSIKECARKSTHGLNGFLLIVVGLAPFPKGLNVSLHNANEHVGLKAETDMPRINKGLLDERAF